MSTLAVLSRVRRSRLMAIVALLCGTVTPVHAQDVTEVSLKGAFLLNFAKFAEWPSETLPSAQTLSACVVGDQAVADAFARSAKGRPIDGRTILVSILEPSATLPPCQVLYISGVGRDRVAETLAALRTTAVLTVSDLDGFASMGGIVEVLVEAGKMRFRINARAAKRARVQISSRLLALADLVEDAPPAPTNNQPVRALVPNRPGRDLLFFLGVRSAEWARHVTPWGRH